MRNRKSKKPKAPKTRAQVEQWIAHAQLLDGEQALMRLLKRLAGYRQTRCVQRVSIAVNLLLLKKFNRVPFTMRGPAGISIQSLTSAFGKTHPPQDFMSTPVVNPRKPRLVQHKAKRGVEAHPRKPNRAARRMWVSWQKTWQGMLKDEFSYLIGDTRPALQNIPPIRSTQLTP